MKMVLRALLAISAILLLAPSTVQVAEMEWLGRLSTMIGAERESFHRPDSTGGGARFHVTPEVLLVAPIPFTPFAIQANANYVGGGAQYRWGFGGGPVVAWDGGLGQGGKAGVFFAYQHRKYQGSCSDSNSSVDFNNAWVRPAASFYFPDINVDAWMSQPISREHDVFACEGDRRKVFRPASNMRAVINYFPPVPLNGKNGNVELSLGIDVSNLWGPSLDLSPGVSPVAGVAIMPWQNLEVTLFRASFDVNHSRYKVNTGVQYYFNIGSSKNPSPTLIEMRRKYLEPTLEPGSVGTMWNRSL